MASPTAHSSTNYGDHWYRNCSRVQSYASNERAVIIRHRVARMRARWQAPADDPVNATVGVYWMPVRGHDELMGDDELTASG
jgi:hypothetical protein